MSNLNMDYGLPAAFHYSVQIGNAVDEEDCAFQEVSGFEQEMELETVQCGGENRFVYQLPSKMKPGRLVLKRCVAPSSSPLVSWCRKVLNGGASVQIETANIQVQLLDAQVKPLRLWSVMGAFPVKWHVDSLSSTKNEVAIEIIELAYLYCERRL